MAVDDLSATFARLVTGANEAVRLDRCALEIGRILDPDVRPERTLATLDDYAARIRPRLSEGAPAAERVEAVRRFLFDETGFEGDTEDYYAPRNSCLHIVVERRTGLPITLAVLMIEVGRRLGADLQGVGTPGHFLVKFVDDDGEHFLDPFQRGRAIPSEGLRRRLRATAQTTGAMAAVTKRQILQRVLQNLKGAFIRRRDFEGAVNAAGFLLALTPWALEEIRDRGFLLYELGRYDESVADLRAYHEHAKLAPDVRRVAALIERVEDRLAASDDAPTPSD